MLQRWTKWLAIGTAFTLLTACQAKEETKEAIKQEETAHTHDAVDIEALAEKAKVEGLSDHYHTGDRINLIAKTDEENVHWHWYVKQDKDDWRLDELAKDNTFAITATKDFEIVAVLYREGKAIARTSIMPIKINDHGHNHKHEHEQHDHKHAHNDKTVKIHEGFFEDAEVKDRPLTDWAGDWQSIYPLMNEPAFQAVFEHKAEKGDKTVAEYKTYYQKGYKTDVDRIVIDNYTFTFYQGNQAQKANYSYDGYEILTYDKGNRGVRYIFKKEAGDESMPQYMQFSDHNIAPTVVDHFHLYWGEDRTQLLTQLSNWPTYFPSDFTTDDIIHDLLAH